MNGVLDPRFVSLRGVEPGVSYFMNAVDGVLYEVVGLPAEPPPLAGMKAIPERSRVLFGAPGQKDHPIYSVVEEDASIILDKFDCARRAYSSLIDKSAEE